MRASDARHDGGCCRKCERRHETTLWRCCTYSPLPVTQPTKTSSGTPWRGQTPRSRLLQHRADKRFVTPFFFFLFGWHRNRTNWSPRREKYTHATSMCRQEVCHTLFFFLFGWHRNRTNWSPRREKYTHATSMCNKQPRSDQASPSPPLQRTQRHVPAEPQAQAARLILRRCRGRDNNGKHAPQEQQLANT